MANIKEFIQCGSDHYTPGRGGTATDRVVVHYTATSASARNNCVYFSRNENQGASAHYFIDKDGGIYQSVKESDRAWHAGNWAMNCRSIGIEVVSAGEDFTEAQIASLAALIADIKGRYSIGDVIRHYDVTGKLCPAPYVNASKWATLKARITGGSSSGSTTTTVSGTVSELAQRVINGEFGNGDARKAALGDRYDEVQAEVNRILGGGSTATATKSVEELAQEVINGAWGNGDDRKQRLTAAGYDYSAVQAKVNELLGASSSVDIDALARAVIRGEYGNGDERKRKLGSNYEAVQKRVNELLS